MNSKLKVVFCSDMLVRDFDGCQRTIFQIIDRKPEEVDIMYITGENHSLDNSEHVVEIPQVKVPFNTTYKMALPIFKQKRIEEELNTFNPEIVHIANPSTLGQYVQRYANKRGLPVTTIYHTHYPSYVSYYLKHLPFLIRGAKTLITRHLRQFYNNCNVVLVPTKQMKEDLFGYGINASKLRIWERGIDRNVFCSTPQPSDNELDGLLSKDRCNILFASRLVWEKNLKVLAEIYIEAELRNLPYNFIIAGDGVARADLEKKMPKATFLGTVGHDMLTSLYRRCDVFVFPSISETYGNVLIEAMGCGLPCVVASGGGPLSFVNDGYNGLLVQPENTSDYIDAISRLTIDSGLRESVIKNGLEFTSTLDWNVLVNRFYNMLSQLSIEKQTRLVA